MASACSGHAPGHICLPTELILQIAQDLHHFDLLSLAMVSRRLNHIAVPLYLQRRGVQDSRGNLKVDFNLSESNLLNSRDLTCIKIAFFLSTAHTIEFIFRDFRYALRDMEEAAHLLSRFTHLDGVILTFRRVATWLLEIILHRQECVTAVSLPMGILLNAIYATPCASFAVRYIMGRRVIESNMTGPLSDSLTPLGHKIQEVGSEPDWQIPGVSGLPLATLKVFHLESLVYLCHPFLAWVLQTLERSSQCLVELSLHVFYISAKDWAHFLPRISLPSLLKLSLAGHNLDFPDLFLFFHRHPHLVSLSLGDRVLSRECEDPERLPNGVALALTSLRGPVDAISHLLHQHEQFHHLVDIDIQPFSGKLDSEKRLEKLNEVLALVAMLAPVDKQNRLTIALFRLFACPPFQTSMGSTTNRAERLLWHVRSLELRLDPVSQPFDTMWDDRYIVANWIALYPALREVTFARTFFSFGFSEANKRLFVLAIAAACPKMEYVAIGADRRSVDTWREGVV